MDNQSGIELLETAVIQLCDEWAITTRHEDNVLVVDCTNLDADGVAAVTERITSLLSEQFEDTFSCTVVQTPDGVELHLA
jgi:hypothetical protein